MDLPLSWSGPREAVKLVYFFFKIYWNIIDIQRATHDYYLQFGEFGDMCTFELPLPQLKYLSHPKVSFCFFSFVFFCGKNT